MADARTRHDELTHILQERRQLLREALSAGHEDEIQQALTQLKAETLLRVDAALAEHSQRLYGWCRVCAEEIPLARLRVLPFASRCAACEAGRARGVREQGERGPLTPLIEVLG